MPWHVLSLHYHRGAWNLKWLENAGKKLGWSAPPRALLAAASPLLATSER